jgi:hypothetical protein
MLTEGAVGLWHGLSVRSIALTGWALGSAVKDLASVIVVWWFTGSRTLSETAERRAQRGVAVSFWLIAPYIATESVRNLLGEQRAKTTLIGMVLTALAVVLMPLLGYAKHRLADRLDSAATTGEGTQNLSLRLTSDRSADRAGGHRCLAERLVARPSNWPSVAAVAAWEGVESWRGEDCC